MQKLIDDEDEDINERRYLVKIEFIYDYHEDKLVKFDFNKELDPKEMTQVSNQFLFYPSCGQGQVKWYFVVVGY